MPASSRCLQLVLANGSDATGKCITFGTRSVFPLSRHNLPYISKTHSFGMRLKRVISADFRDMIEQNINFTDIIFDADMAPVWAIDHRYDVSVDSPRQRFG